jgi:hypothetical protein
MNTIREAAEMALEFIDKVNMWGCLFAQFEDGMCATRAALRTALDAKSEADPVARDGWVLRDVYFHDGEPEMHRDPNVHQPDAWRTEARNEHGLPVFFCASEVKQAGPGLIPLYTAPPLLQRQPLTDDEIDGLMADTWGGACIAPQSAPAFARAIERAHGIGSEE